MDPGSIRIITLGCKVNQCDGEEIGRRFAAMGYEVRARGGADLFVVNTCTVTGTADAKARKLIRRLAREHPGARIVVTGCWAQREAEAAAALPGVVAVVPNEGKAGIAEVVASGAASAASGAASAVPKPAAGGPGWRPSGLATSYRSNANEGKVGMAEVVAGGAASAVPKPAAGGPGWRPSGLATSYRSNGNGGGGRTRAFVKIQDGCDHRCAYCAVPEARGTPASRPMAEVLSELRAIADGGAQEVVLCGIRLGAYGRERGVFGLADLLREMRALSVPRVRLSSIEPMDIGEGLLCEMGDHPSLCHHLHLPLQSGDDGVLTEMGRGYSTADFVGLVERIRTAWPDAAITTDVMVGFPGETDKQFRNTVGFVQRTGFSRLHVFPYSRRPGTAAAERRDQVPENVKRERAEELIGVGAELEQRFADAWVGKGVEALFEEEKGGLLTGLTEHYVRVRCAGLREWIGTVVMVTAESAEGGELVSSGR